MPLRLASANISSGSRLPWIWMWSSHFGSRWIKLLVSCIACSFGVVATTTEFLASSFLPPAPNVLLRGSGNGLRSAWTGRYDVDDMKPGRLQFVEQRRQGLHRALVDVVQQQYSLTLLNEPVQAVLDDLVR